MINSFREFAKSLGELAALQATLRKFGLWVAAVVLLSFETAEAQVQKVWTNGVGTGYGTVGALTQDASGNVYICGTDQYGYLTAKLSGTGSLLWSSRAASRDGITECNGIAVDNSGGVYVTGGLPGSRSFILTYCDFFQGCQDYRYYSPDLATIKYDDRGHRQWEDDYFESPLGHFLGIDLSMDSSGNIYVVGYNIAIPSYAGSIPIIGTRTIKYDPSGNRAWVRTNYPIASSVLDRYGKMTALDHGGNLCETGPAGTRKWDPNGNLLWSWPISGAVLRQDSADNIYVTANNASGPTMKFGPSGNLLWTAPFGGWAMTIDQTGNVYISDFRLPAGSASYITTKLNSNGELLWRAINIRPGAYPEDLVTDGQGNVYVTGEAGTVKYDNNGILLWQIADGATRIVLDAVGNPILASGSGAGLQIAKFTQTNTPGAPTITAPPFQPLVRPGDSVTLSVGVAGVAPLTYQWRNGSGPILDETNATFTVTNLQAAGTNYSLVVSNAVGATASPQIYVTVLNPLPSQTVVLGATALFRAPVNGQGPTVYQWRFNGANLLGQTQSALQITNVGPNQVGDYDLVVSNRYGNCLTSTVAQLSLDTDAIQRWAAAFPAGTAGDFGRALGVDTSGNVFVVGYSDCGHKTVKYNSNGLKIWEVCDGNYSSLGGLVVDSIGNVCIASGFVTKYGANGSLAWKSTFDDGAGSTNNVAASIAADGGGNIYVTGYASATNGSGILTVKFNPNGQQLWSRLNVGTSDDFSEDMTVDISGNVYVCGAVYEAVGAYNYAVIKYDANGNQLWTRTYDGPTSGSDIANRIVVDATGAVYVTGWSPGDDFITDFATIKFDGNGNQLWVARYAGPGGGEDNPHGIAVDGAGNVYVTGSSVGTNSIGSAYDIATVKYAPDGTELWARRYSGPANLNDYNRALALDASGNVYVEGHSDSGPGPNPTTEVVTLSYDPAGNLRWAARCDTGVESGAYYRNGSILVDSGANVYVGDTTFVTGSPAFLVLKYSQRTPTPARIGVPAILPDGRIRCAVSGDPGLRYIIQSSGDLINWNSITSVLLNATGTGEFWDPIPAVTQSKFYRLLQP